MCVCVCVCVCVECVCVRVRMSVSRCPPCALELIPAAFCGAWSHIHLHSQTHSLSLTHTHTHAHTYSEKLREIDGNSWERGSGGRGPGGVILSRCLLLAASPVSKQTSRSGRGSVSPLAPPQNTPKISELKFSQNVWDVKPTRIEGGGAKQVEMGERETLPPPPSFPSGRCRVSMAHSRQSRPDSGLGFQVQDLKTF